MPYWYSRSVVVLRSSRQSICAYRLALLACVPYWTSDHAELPFKIPRISYYPLSILGLEQSIILLCVIVVGLGEDVFRVGEELLLFMWCDGWL